MLASIQCLKGTEKMEITRIRNDFTYISIFEVLFTTSKSS